MIRNLAAIALGLSLVTNTTVALSETVAPDPTTLQPRSEGPAAQNERAELGANLGVVLPAALSALQRAAISEDAKAELKNHWISIQQAYPFLGDRGLLIELDVGVVAASASTPTPAMSLQQVFIVGIGKDPAHAWAERRDDPPALKQSYLLSQDESWFLWIKPSNNGWPKLAPTYADALQDGLLDRRELRAPVVIEGTTIRSRLLADEGLRREAELRAIESTARAAQAAAANEGLRRVAKNLQASALKAITELAEINERLRRDLQSSARAQEALMILDGVVAVGSAADKTLYALSKLGSDAPKGPLIGMNEEELRTLIKSLADSKKAATIELQRQQTLIMRDINGEVEVFSKSFEAGTILLPWLK